MLDELGASKAGAENNAEIVKIVDGKQAGERIRCKYRPNKLAFTKINTWNRNKVMEGNVPALTFAGGECMTLKLDLFFDTYATDKPINKKDDVRNYTEKIWELMLVPKGSETKQPPHCQFIWGKTQSFEAIIKSVTETFTLFLENGTPVRSTMAVELEEVKDTGWYPKQNPTTGSVPGYKTRRIKQGETLDWIAFEEFSLIT